MELKGLRRSTSSSTLKVEEGTTAPPKKNALTSSKQQARELPKEALEALQPVLNNGKGNPIAPSAKVRDLWGETSQTRSMPPKLQKTQEQLEALEKKMAEVAARVEESFKSSDVNAQLDVLDSLAQDKSLDPWLQRCFTRYAKLLRAYVADGGRGMSPEQLRGKIRELVERATQRAKDNGAHVELLKTVEVQQGTDTDPNSFTSLLNSWFNLWSVFQKLMVNYQVQQTNRKEEREEVKRLEESEAKKDAYLDQLRRELEIKAKVLIPSANNVDASR